MIKITTTTGADQEILYKNGKYKTSKEQAERHSKIMRTTQRLLNIADELNEGWVPNWIDKDEYKFYIHYSHLSKKLFIKEKLVCSSLNIYFKSLELAREAITRLDEEDIKVLKGGI